MGEGLCRILRVGQLCPLTRLHNPVAADRVHFKTSFRVLPIFKASMLVLHTPDPVTIELCIKGKEEN